MLRRGLLLCSGQNPKRGGKQGLGFRVHKTWHHGTKSHKIITLNYSLSKVVPIEQLLASSWNHASSHNGRPHCDLNSRGSSRVEHGLSGARDYTPLHPWGLPLGSEGVMPYTIIELYPIHKPPTSHSPHPPKINRANMNILMHITLKK